MGLFALGPVAVWEPLAGVRQRRQSATSPRPRATTLESVVPQDVAIVVLIRDLLAFREGLRQSALARAIAGTQLPLARYLREVVDPLELAGAADLGAEARYALVVPEIADAPRAVVLVETASDERAARALERLRTGLERLGPVRALQGRPISIIQATPPPPGTPLGVAHHGRVLLFGPMAAIERLMEDQAKRPKLAEASAFRLARQRCAGGTAFTFFNLERLTPYLIGQWTARQSGGALSLAVPILHFIGLSAFKAVGSSLTFDASGAREEVCALVDRGYNPMIAALMELPAIEFTTAHAIPEDAAFAIFAGVDLVRLYNAAVATLGPLLTAQLGGQSPEAAIALLETQLGFRLKDELLAALGPEVALAWSASADRLERDLVLSVRNPDLLRAILEKVVARQGQRPIAYKAHTIYPVTDEASIAVTATEALIARIERVKHLLDERERGRVLGRTPEFVQWLRERPPQAALGIYATRAALQLPWLRPLVIGARSDQSFPPHVFTGFGVRDPLGMRGTFASALGSFVFLDALLAVRSAAPESSFLGTLARFTRLLAEGAR